MKLTGAAILVSRGMKVLQAAPAAYPYRSASGGLPSGQGLGGGRHGNQSAARRCGLWVRLVRDPGSARGTGLADLRAGAAGAICPRHARMLAVAESVRP